MSLTWPHAHALRARRAASTIRPPISHASANAPQPKKTDSPAIRTGHPANLLIHMAALFSVIVLLSPSLDLMVSGWFVAPTGDFALANNATLIWVRDLNRMLPPVLIIAVLALLMAQACGLRHRALPRPHEALFVLAFYAAGPGLIVNGLKELVGRARPRNIVEFGGTELFTSAWQASTACARNCSFPSGEAGSAVAMLAFVFLLPSSWRRPALCVLVPIAIVFSVNRIAFGAHFMSDVVISWLLCGAVMLSLRPVFLARAAAIDAAVTGRLAQIFSRDRRPARPHPRST